MPQDTLISVEHVSKKYCRSMQRSMLYGIQDIVCDTFNLNDHCRQLRKDEFWAVADVSFEVKRGECLGIIGPNGAGKSTLLKMLNGIFPPDKGRIAIRGGVGALIELGAGSHPMLTGRENIYINGAILGLRKEEIDRQFDQIVAFAELEPVIDTPVKFYSSGMHLRLGFSIAAHLQPDVLLIDEILAVGDNKFRSKCTHKIAQALKDGTALIFVSHNMNEIVRMCHSVLWLDKGKSVRVGDLASTVGAYLAQIDREETRHIEQGSPSVLAGARLKNVIICDEEGSPKTTFHTGESMTVHFDYEKKQDIKALTFSFAMTLGDEKSYVSCHSPWTGFAVYSNKWNGRVTLRIPQLLLNRGHYLLNVGLWDEEFRFAYDWRWNFCHIEIKNDIEKFSGRFVLPHTWSESVNLGGAFS